MSSFMKTIYKTYGNPESSSKCPLSKTPGKAAGTVWQGGCSHPQSQDGSPDDLPKSGMYRKGYSKSWNKFLLCKHPPAHAHTHTNTHTHTHTYTHTRTHKCDTSCVVIKGQVQGWGWFLTWFPLLKFPENNDVGEIVMVINARKQAFSVVPKASPWHWKSCAHMRTTSLWGVATKWLVAKG